MEKDFESVIENAKASKHTDAILFLIENKSDLAKKVQDIVQKAIPEDEQLKKAIAIVSEYVFNGCVEILSNDKKDE